MEINLLAHIVFTLFCSILILFFGFSCLKRKKLVFLALLTFAVKSFIIYCIFQFPPLFNSSFFVDSKAYQFATAKTSQYFQLESFFPSNNVYEIWDTQVNYVYALIVAHFYLIFPSATTGFLLNAFFYLLSLILLYKVLEDKENYRQIDIGFVVLLFWPSLFFNSLLFIRDGFVLLLIVFFLYCYSKKQLLLRFFLIVLCIFLEAKIRWYVGLSMVLFLIGNYIISIGKKSKLIFILLSFFFFLLIGLLINYLGFTLDSVQGFRNILTGLEGSYNANSVYLKEFIIDNYLRFILFIPLSIFFFLFSPIIPSDGNPISLLACIENLVILMFAIYILIPNKKAFKYIISQSNILKNIFLFLIPLLLVYSFGVADSGTAMRQKGFLIYVIVFTFYKKREWALKS